MKETLLKRHSDQWWQAVKKWRGIFFQVAIQNTYFCTWITPWKYPIHEYGQPKITYFPNSVSCHNSVLDPYALRQFGREISSFHFLAYTSCGPVDGLGLCPYLRFHAPAGEQIGFESTIAILRSRTRFRYESGRVVGIRSRWYDVYDNFRVRHSSVRVVHLAENPTD